MLHHIALETRQVDAEADVRFFALLGFEEVEPPASLGERARWLERDGQQIHLMFSDDPVAPPGGHVAIVAADYDATIDALRRAGFEPEPRTEHWGSPRSFVRTPSGHRVEVMAWPPDPA